MSRSVVLQFLGGARSWHGLRRSIHLWPPFLGAGIRIKPIAPDMKAIDVEMKLRFWNANYVGTHSGGSLFAMTDPFYMLMLMADLACDYIGWDKAASIGYRKPRKGTVRAKLKTLPQYEPVFQIAVKDDAGVAIAEVEDLLHVSKKQDVLPTESGSGEGAQPTA
jgi:hypothetical protein